MSLEIRKGVNEHQQESAFMNATLQGEGDVAFSIATHLEIPSYVHKTEEEVTAYIEQMLGVAEGIVKALSFEVEIGKARR